MFLQLMAPDETTGRARPRTPTWILPILEAERYQRFSRRRSGGVGYDAVRELVNTRKLRTLVRKLPPGNALREFVLKDPEEIPLDRLEDYWTLAVHALLPR